MSNLKLISKNLAKSLGLGLFFMLVVCCPAGCAKKMVNPPKGREDRDLNEDFYHRTKAGLFRPDKDPTIVLFTQSTGPDSRKRLPQIPLWIKWDRGTFAVNSNGDGLVVFYMDSETAYSHVKVQSHTEDLEFSLQFRDYYNSPIR